MTDAESALGPFQHRDVFLGAGDHVKKNRAEFLGQHLLLTLLGPNGFHYAIDHHYLLSASTHRT